MTKPLSSAAGKALDVEPPAEVELPRDRNGRVVRVGALVAVWGGGRATVDSILPDGQIAVTRTDGKTLTLDASHVTVLRDVAPAAPAEEEGDDPTVEDGADNPEEGAEDGEEDEPEAEEVVTPPGTSAAPDAEPDGALATLVSPDRTAMAWMQVEDDEAIGYYRERAEDPATTIRYDDSAQWAEDMDRHGMVDPETDPPAPDQTAAIAANEPFVPDEDTHPAEMPSEPGRGNGAATPDALAAFYGDGLLPTAPENLNGTATIEDGAQPAPDLDAVQARAEAIDMLAERLTHLDEADYMSPEQAGILAQIDAEEIVYLRQPRRGYEDQWVYSEFDRGWFERIRGQRPMPEGTEVVTGDMLRRIALRDRVGSFLALWATTSNGVHDRALALQEVAIETFGLADPAGWDIEEVHGLSERITEVREREGALMGEFLSAMYDLTQEMLRDAGITHLQVYRGHKVYDETPEWAAPAADGEQVTAEVPLRPLSSFTTDPLIAGHFARGASSDEAYIIEGTLPVERIIATPRTGFGCLSLAEVVAIAGPGEWTVRLAGDLDGPTWPDRFQPDAEGWDGEGEAEDWDEDPPDPATLPAPLLADAAELASALAAAAEDTDARRAELVDRAAAMGRLDLVPETWQGDGTIVIPPKGEAIGALTDTEYEARIVAIESALAAAVDAGQMTDAEHTLDPDRTVYSADRAAKHIEIIDTLYGIANAPTEGRALIVGGLPGSAPVDVARMGTHLNPADYLVVSVTAVMQAMAEADMIPTPPEMSPMDVAALAHEEAEHVALLLAARAMDERRNLCWDIAMTDHEAIESRVAALRSAGYGVIEGVFSDIPIEHAVERSRAAHRLATDQWRNGDGVGGRYIPAVAIRAHRDTDWSSSNRAAFEDAKDQFTQWAVFDSAITGSPPVRTATSHGFGADVPDSTREQETE